MPREWGWKSAKRESRLGRGMSLCSPASSLRLMTHASRGGSAIHLGSRLTARKRRPAAALQRARGVPRRNIRGNREKRVAANCGVVGYNGRGWGAGRRYSPYNLEISRRNAGTDITSLDRCQLRAEAEAQGAQTLSVWVHAGSAGSGQTGVCVLRSDSVSAAHFEERIDAGRVFQGRG